MWGMRGVQALPSNERDAYRSSHEHTKGLLGDLTNQQEFDGGALFEVSMNQVCATSQRAADLPTTDQLAIAFGDFDLKMGPPFYPSPCTHLAQPCDCRQRFCASAQNHYYSYFGLHAHTCQLNQTNNQLNQTNNQLLTLNATLQTVLTRLETAETDRKQMQTDLKTVKSKLETAETDWKQMQTDWKQMQTDLETVKSELEIVKTKLKDHDNMFMRAPFHKKP